MSYISDNLFPTYFSKSVYHMNFKKVWDAGYRGIIFDIDNTLVGHDAPADDHAKRLIEILHGIGFETVIVSNNEEPRVKSFSDAIGCKYVYKALKPRAYGYNKALEVLHMPKKVLCIGDQIYTDIWGANRAGLDSVLVRKLHEYEPPHIHLKRMLEMPVLWFYVRKKKRTGTNKK